MMPPSYQHAIGAQADINLPMDAGPQHGGAGPRLDGGPRHEGGPRRVLIVSPVSPHRVASRHQPDAAFKLWLQDRDFSSQFFDALDARGISTLEDCRYAIEKGRLTREQLLQAGLKAIAVERFFDQFSGSSSASPAKPGSGGGGGRDSLSPIVRRWRGREGGGWDWGRWTSLTIPLPCPPFFPQSPGAAAARGTAYFVSGFGSIVHLA